jgi:hypothetical protein
MKRVSCILPSLLAICFIPTGASAQPDQALPRSTTPAAKVVIPSREVQERFLLTGDLGVRKPIDKG